MRRLVTLSVGILWAGKVFAADTVLINELFYDAVGSDTGHEWVELFNTSGGDVDLSAWKLQRGGTAFQTAFTFPAGAKIAPGQHLLVGESQVSGASFTGTLAFQNGGGATDGVRLVNADGDTVDTLLYDQPNANALPDTNGAPGTAFAPPTSEGASLARLPSGNRANGDSRDFSVTGSVTPGQTNVSGSASTAAASATPTSGAAAASTVNTADAVVVNEILPNPSGSDEDGEFIELWNSGSASADLSGHKVDDADGGSTPYVIPNGTTIAAKAYLLLRRPDTKLAFNNDTDRGRLLRPDGSLIHELVYMDVPKGEGSAVARRSDGTASWTTTPTPGSENQFASSGTSAHTTTPTASASAKASPTSSAAAKSSPAATSTASAAGRVRGTTTVVAAPGEAARTSGASGSVKQQGSTKTGAEEMKETESLPLADLRSKDIGTHVRTQGTVAVLPGVLDPHLFYVAGSGIGVVLTDGAFPELRLGDVVELSGMLAEPRKERLLVLARADDLKKISDGPVPESHQVRTGEVGESWEGSLVRIEGKIIEAGNDQFRIDDGSGAVTVVRVGTVEWPHDGLTKDAAITVTGIVSESDEGFRILPRSAEDLRIGEHATETTPSSPKKKTWLRWVGLALVVGAALFYIARRRKQ